jgi:hypothetical protein
MMRKMIVMMLSCLFGGFLAEEQRDGRAVLVYEEFWDGSDDVTPRLLDAEGKEIRPSAAPSGSKE